MRTYKFMIHFKNGEKIIVDAICAKAAEILAQAGQIHKGHDYDVEWAELLE